MEIVRERFLDDTKLYHLTMAVRSRTTEMHSVLTSLTADEREAVGKAVARALDDIATILTPLVDRERARVSALQPISG